MNQKELRAFAKAKIVSQYGFKGALVYIEGNLSWIQCSVNHA